MTVALANHSPHRTVWVAALVASSLATAVAIGPLEGIPHIQDEVVYTLQARLFAWGQRTGPPAESATLLQYPFWVNLPQSHGIFPPGWPALLALGSRLGVPWLVNPLLALAWPLVVWGLAREFFREPVAIRAAWITALSPGMLVLAGSRMAHTSTALALAIALLVVVRRRDPTWAWIGAAIAVSYVVLARPLDALVLGGPLLLLGLRQAPSWTARAALVGLPAIATALIALDNHALTGAWTTFPADPWFDAWRGDASRPPGCNRLGFGLDVGCHRTLGTWGHTPTKALQMAGQMALNLDRLLLGLPGGLLLAGLGLVRWGRRGSWTLGWVLALVLAYGLYWSPGPGYGARYWHPLYILLPIWMSCGLEFLPARIRWIWVLGPIAAAPTLWGDLSRDYWCVGNDVAQEARQRGLVNDVLLVEGTGTREEAWPSLGDNAFTCDPLLGFGSAFLLNDPTGVGIQVRHAPVEATSHPESLHRVWPDRRIWLIEQDVSTRSWRWTLLP